MARTLLSFLDLSALGFALELQDLKVAVGDGVMDELCVVFDAFPIDECVHEVVGGLGAVVLTAADIVVGVAAEVELFRLVAVFVLGDYDVVVTHRLVVACVDLLNLLLLSDDIAERPIW